MIPGARARGFAKSAILCALLLVLTQVSAPASDMTSTLLIGGSKIDVTIESGQMTVSQAELMQWVKSAAEAVATYYGRYPVPHVRVQIIPVDGSGIRHGQTFGYEGGLIKIRSKNIGDDFREGKITLPVVLAFRRGNASERAFWVKALERGEIGAHDLDHAIGLMTKHRALEDTISRAHHYGAMAVDALALFPASPMKTALEQVVAFCLARSH
jgi:hypothetical protein